MSKTCGTTGRVIYTERKVADRAALKGWVRGGRKLALTVKVCPDRPHYHLVPVNEEVIRANLEILEEGDLARVVNATDDLSGTRLLGSRHYPPGFEFVVEDYTPPEVARKGVAFYWGRTGDGGLVCIPARDVEQVQSAEERGIWVTNA